MLLDRHLLEALAAQWRQQGAPVLHNLRSGLSVAEMDAITATVGCRLPAEARQWWGWHDGVLATPGRPSIGREIGGPGYVYVPLEEAAGDYRRLRELSANVAGPNGDPDELWRPGWWPISSDIKGAVLACECDVDEDAPTPIRAVHFADATHRKPPVLASFGELVQHFIDAIERGVWYYDARAGRWEHRFERQTTEQRATRIL